MEEKMGGIGGFFDRERKLSADRLVRMSRFALEKGDRERTGYWKDGVGLFQNGGYPTFDSCGEQDYILISDALSEAEGAELLLRYRQEGRESLGDLCLGKIFALYDGSRSEMILVRGRESARALYYMQREGRLCFSSRIGSLLSAADDLLPEITRERLWAYLSLPCGSYCPQLLYEDLKSLPRGMGGLCHGLGVSCFPLSVEASRKESWKTPICIDSKENLRKSLWANLYRYEAPYLTVPSLRGREKKRLEERMRELFSECDPVRLAYLLGGRQQDFLDSSGGEEERIRRMGLLIQTVLWSQWVSVI